MTNENKKLKIVWAVDPFEKAGPQHKNVANALAYLARKRGAVIQPVYVLKTHPDLVPAFNLPPQTRFADVAQAAFKKFSAAAGLRNPGRLEVLVNDSLSARGAAGRLAGYAADEDASLILAATHGKGGLQSLLLGSFAESLTVRSKVPVFLVGARMQEFRANPRILFPTDLAAGSLAFFRQTLTLARALGAGVTIFHSVEIPIEPTYAGTLVALGGPWTAYPDFVNQQARHARKTLGNWVKAARREGVDADFHVETRGMGPAEAIVAFARRGKLGLIALGSRSGPVSAALMGSVVRQTARLAPCPVWVLKPGRVRRHAAAKAHANGRSAAAA